MIHASQLMRMNIGGVSALNTIKYLLKYLGHVSLSTHIFHEFRRFFLFVLLERKRVNKPKHTHLHTSLYVCCIMTCVSFTFRYIYERCVVGLSVCICSVYVRGTCHFLKVYIFQF